MRREKMSSVDNAWLRMDSPSNLMQIVGVMIFDSPADFPRLQHTVATRFLRFGRFRQRVAQDLASAYWEEDPEFDLHHHLRRVVLPGQGELADLKAYIADQVSEPLNPARPLWDMQLVESPAGLNAIIMRFHHSIADGIALISVMLSLCDADRDGAEAKPKPTDTSRESEEGFWWKAFNPVAEAWLGSLGLLTNPGRAFSYARMGAGIATDLANIALMADDSKTRLKGTATTTKCVAWSEPLPLPEIKAVGRLLGCSVNDLLLAAVAGALRAYLFEQGDEVEGVELRAMVPVNLREEGEEQKLGNKFGLVPLVLPVGIENPLSRLYETRQRMEALKHSYTAMLAFTILGIAGMMPKFIQEQAIDLLANKASAVMTNVPGPQKPLYLAGAKIDEMMFWVPQSGNICMGVSILSYDDRVQFGLITDHARVPDPEKIVARFAREFEKLLWLVLMEPCERLRDPEAVEAALRADLDSLNRTRRAGRPGL